MTEFQPTLPVEVPWTESELAFMEDSPPGLFPENQDSNFGHIIRKIWADRVQILSDQMTTMYAERFVPTSSIHLDEWEEQVGLPIAPTGLTITQRRAAIMSRINVGLFTRDKIADVIEPFLQSTFGESVALTPEGVALVPAGVPLFGGTAPVSTLYRVYENPQNYSYEVWIKNTLVPDMPNLIRGLDRITPGGMSYTIDNSKSNILDYRRNVLNRQPIGYWRLGSSANDFSGYGNHGTINGAALVAAPGLLHSAVADGDGARDFAAGSTNWISVPPSTRYGGFQETTIHALIRLDGTIPGGAEGIILHVSNEILFRMNTGNSIGFYIWNPATSDWAGRITGGYAPSAATLHVTAVKRALQIEIWVNGVRADIATDPGAVPDVIPNPGAGVVAIGGVGGTTNVFDGVIDELAFYNYALTPEQILEDYRTSINVA